MSRTEILDRVFYRTVHADAQRQWIKVSFVDLCDNTRCIKFVTLSSWPRWELYCIGPGNGVLPFSFFQHDIFKSMKINHTLPIAFKVKRSLTPYDANILQELARGMHQIFLPFVVVPFFASAHERQTARHDFRSIMSTLLLPIHLCLLIQAIESPINVPETRRGYSNGSMTFEKTRALLVKWIW